MWQRWTQALVTYLTEPEIDALIDAPDRSTWTGRRDHALLLLAIQTGTRASELTALRCQDVHLGTGAHVDDDRQRLVFILHLLGLIGGDAGSSGASRRACGAGGRVRRAVRRAVRCVRWPCGR